MLQSSGKKESKYSENANSMIQDGYRGWNCGAGGGIRTHVARKDHRLSKRTPGVSFF